MIMLFWGEWRGKNRVVLEMVFIVPLDRIMLPAVNMEPVTGSTMWALRKW